MVKDSLIAAGEWDTIRDMTREAVKTMLGFELAHIGINEENAEKAEKVAKMFETVFGFEKIEKTGSYFADKYIEIMKSPYLGKNGHIAIKTNYADRAVHYLENLGIEFIEETKKYDENGHLKFAYFKEEFGGFAVHLLQK